MIWRDSRSRSRPTNRVSGDPFLALRNGRLHAQNYVGIVETRRGTVIEILPKVDLSHDGDGSIGRHPDQQSDGRPDSVTGRDEATRRVFLTMLRDWRGLGQAQIGRCRHPRDPTLRYVRGRSSICS